MAQKESPTKSRQNPFTLLAVTALATSNLMVGVLQGNTLLILASSILSAGFAYVYSVRSGMISAWRKPAKTDDQVSLGSDGAAILARKRRFPLWLFLALIFVLMPAILLFLQTTEQ